jgi:hypothetical protein
MLEKLWNSLRDASKALEQFEGCLNCFVTAGGMLDKIWNRWGDA